MPLKCSKRWNIIVKLSWIILILAFFLYVLQNTELYYINKSEENYWYENILIRITFYASLNKKRNKTAMKQ